MGVPSMEHGARHQQAPKEGQAPGFHLDQSPSCPGPRTHPWAFLHHLLPCLSLPTPGLTQLEPLQPHPCFALAHMPALVTSWI